MLFVNISRTGSARNLIQTVFWSVNCRERNPAIRFYGHSSETYRRFKLTVNNHRTRKSESKSIYSTSTNPVLKTSRACFLFSNNHGGLTSRNFPAIGQVSTTVFWRVRYWHTSFFAAPILLSRVTGMPLRSPHSRARILYERKMRCKHEKFVTKILIRSRYARSHAAFLEPARMLYCFRFSPDRLWAFDVVFIWVRYNSDCWSYEKFECKSLWTKLLKINSYGYMRSE